MEPRTNDAFAQNREPALTPTPTSYLAALPVPGSLCRLCSERLFLPGLCRKGTSARGQGESSARNKLLPWRGNVSPADRETRRHREKSLSSVAGPMAQPAPGAAWGRSRSRLTSGLLRAPDVPLWNWVARISGTGGGLRLAVIF